MTAGNIPERIATHAKDKKVRIILPVALAVLILLAALWLAVFSSQDSATRQIATFTAQRGPLTISVVESGTIKARDQIIIKNEVEGRTSIISLISEGTHVKPGELLVELDASGLEDAKIDQEIRVQNAEASYINAKENLAVVKNQAKSDISKAKLVFEFAKQDLTQYKNGEYPNKLSAAQSRITLAQEELTRAQETLKWSERLNTEKYISQTELQADQLSERRKALDVELAKNDLDLLQNFTYQRKIAQLESDVEQAEMALERSTRKATADVVQAEADLKAKIAEFNRQRDKLEKIKDQIKKTRIHAPAAGLVIYATSAQSGGWRHNTEPLDEGQEVRERQELIYLPTTTSALAEVGVHESNLEKVSKGLPAVIHIDALPGKKIFGTVAVIAPLPDAQSIWINPDLKIYTTEIILENSGETLKTGMSCRAEIICTHYEDAVYIPIQAVLRVRGETTVFIVEGDRIIPRKVDIGLDNNRMVHIISGLEKGELVSLTPPLSEGEIPAGDTTMGASISDALKDRSAISSKISEQLGAGNPKLKPANPPPAGTIVTGPPDRQISPLQKAVPKSNGKSLSREQREKMRRQLETMSPEEQQKALEKMKQRSKKAFRDE